MKYRNYGSTVFLTVAKGEEIIETIKGIAKKENMSLAKIDGIGFTDDIDLRVYDSVNDCFVSRHFEIPMEISSLSGNIVNEQDAYKIHIHVNAADTEMQIHGGHLLRCVVGAICELFIEIFA